MFQNLLGDNLTDYVYLYSFYNFLIFDLDFDFEEHTEHEMFIIHLLVANNFLDYYHNFQQIRLFEK